MDTPSPSFAKTPALDADGQPIPEADDNTPQNNFSNKPLQFQTAEELRQTLRYLAIHNPHQLALALSQVDLQHNPQLMQIVVRTLGIANPELQDALKKQGIQPETLASIAQTPTNDSDGDRNRHVDGTAKDTSAQNTNSVNIDGVNLSRSTIEFIFALADNAFKDDPALKDNKTAKALVGIMTTAQVADDIKHGHCKHGHEREDATKRKQEFTREIGEKYRHGGKFKHDLDTENFKAAAQDIRNKRAGGIALQGVAEILAAQRPPMFSASSIEGTYRTGIQLQEKADAAEQRLQHTPAPRRRADPLNHIVGPHIFIHAANTDHAATQTGHHSSRMPPPATIASNSKTKHPGILQPGIGLNGPTPPGHIG